MQSDGYLKAKDRVADAIVDDCAVMDILNPNES